MKIGDIFAKTMPFFLLTFYANLSVIKLNLNIFSSLTLDKQYISHKACVYGLYGCFCFCIDMCYISSFCFLMFFVSFIMLRMDALDMNS